MLIDPYVLRIWEEIGTGESHRFLHYELIKPRKQKWNVENIGMKPSGL
jgi:hypothetical protein